MDIGKKAAADLSRNHLWMTRETRARVEATRLVIVGCGGNGTFAAIQALHLGFRDFFLCDGDQLELDNLNRHVIAKPADVGRAKCDILEQYMRALIPDVRVRVAAEFFPAEPCEAALAESRESCFALGCLDNVHGRLELDVLARKHGRTLLDLGTGFARRGTDVRSAGGQVLVSRPGGACLMCLGFDEGVTRNNYFLPGAEGPEPSALLLNGIIGNLAVELLLRELADPPPVNALFYDRESLRIAAEERRGREHCPVCGPGAHERIRRVASPIEFITA